jgi:hypothetical protein
MGAAADSLYSRAAGAYDAAGMGDSGQDLAPSQGNGSPSGADERTKRLHHRIRIAGVLIIVGLAVEALSLIRVHPVAFLAFMFIGGGFLLAGIAIYLYSLVSV